MKYSISIIIALFFAWEIARAQTEHQKVTAAVVKMHLTDPIGAKITDTKISDLGEITGIVIIAKKPLFYTQQRIMDEFDEVRKKEPPSGSPQGSGFRENITVLSKWSNTGQQFKNEGFNYIAVWEVYKESVLNIYVGNDKLMFMILPIEAWNSNN